MSWISFGFGIRKHNCRTLRWTFFLSSFLISLRPNKSNSLEINYNENSWFMTLKFNLPIQNCSRNCGTLYQKYVLTLTSLLAVTNTFFFWSWNISMNNLRTANSWIPTCLFWPRTAIFSVGWVMTGHHFATICCSGASALRETGCDLGGRPGWMGLSAWHGL